jgi:hypothetical protein
MGKILIATIYLSPNAYITTSLRHMEISRKKQSRICIETVSG